MKKLNLLIIVMLVFSCNMSDQEYELPNNYVFVKEGGNRNLVLKKDELIIDKGAVDFSYNEEFIFFSVDTTYSMEPYKIPKNKLVYYIHDIHEDTLSKPLNYNFVRKFMLKNNIKKHSNILVKQ